MRDLGSSPPVPICSLVHGGKEFENHCSKQAQIANICLESPWDRFIYVHFYLPCSESPASWWGVDPTRGPLP